MGGAARIALLLGLSALLGTAGDQLHVRFGVLSYAPGQPLLFGQALWVPVLFGAAGVVLVLVNGLVLRLDRTGSARRSPAAFARSVAWFFAAYAATAFLAEAPLSLTVALVVAWGARLMMAPSLDRVVASLLFAMAGPLFESALSDTGAFRYRKPDLLLVPEWLPALYLHVALMTREAYLFFFGGVPPRGEGRAPAGG